MHTSSRTALVVLLASTALSAQIKKVVPAEYTHLEGNSRYAFPFAKTDAQMQILTDGRLVSNGAGVISAFAFRPDSPLDATAGYQKNYRATLYTTAVTPAAMTTNPASNIGTATGTMVFDTALSVPAVTAQLTAPAKTFSLRFPVASTYAFDGTKGNLLIHLETRDSGAVSSWYPDSVSRGNPAIRSESTVVGRGCADSSGYGLGLSVGSSSYAGGALVATVSRSPSSTPVGSFTTAFLGLDFSIARPGFPADLGPAGMPGCRLYIDPLVLWSIPEQSGSYAAVNVNIPNTTGVTGASFFLQALGDSPAPGLTGSVLTDVQQVYLAPNPPQASPVEAIYQSGTSWLGAFPTLDLMPIVEYDGVLR